MLHRIRHAPGPPAAGPEARPRAARPEARPLVIAHGLFGSARNWGAVAKRLAAARPVIAVDMRNHGESPQTASHTYPDLAADLAEVIAAEPGGRADVLGHSMGGKAAMALALTAPDRVGRLVVADIAPVAYGHTQMPLVEAMREMDLAGLSGRAEADARLAARVAEPAVRAFLLQSLDLRADPPRWRLNLDTLAAEMDTILGWPDLPGRFEGPALFLSGAASDYVRPEHRETIRALFPEARFAKIPGAGHWLHAEKPRETVAAVEAFLSA
jgi:pimeloyl-ACP methyl ester carboxylesterase